jgi:hypothetical protein
MGWNVDQDYLGKGLLGLELANNRSKCVQKKGASVRSADTTPSCGYDTWYDD